MSRVHFEDSGIVMPSVPVVPQHTSATTIAEQRESLEAIKFVMHVMEYKRNTDPFFRDKHAAMMRMFKFHIRRLECCDELKRILIHKYKQYAAY